MMKYAEQIPGRPVIRRRSEDEEKKIGKFGTWIFDIFVEIPARSSYWNQPEDVRRTHMLNEALVYESTESTCSQRREAFMALLSYGLDTSM